jgi:hypothetical protein
MLGSTWLSTMDLTFRIDSGVPTEDPPNFKTFIISIVKQDGAISADLQ